MIISKMYIRLIVNAVMIQGHYIDSKIQMNQL